MKHLHLSIWRHPETVFLVGYLHPVTLWPTPLGALTRFLGVLWQYLHRILVGIHLLEHHLFTVKDGIPELVFTVTDVNSHVAILYFSRILPTYGKGTLVVLLSHLCADTECQYQGRQYERYSPCSHLCIVSFSNFMTKPPPEAMRT